MSYNNVVCKTQEHEAGVQYEQGHSLSPSSSIINSDDFRSIQRRRATANDRLPGAVLLARERLVERLRGVSVSGNRYILIVTTNETDVCEN